MEKDDKQIMTAGI